ncbi:type II secretion system protein [Pseudoalteromonas sp. MMG010]|uniref:type IV pilus modification PilV family protein n=1 Tax=Pseudoalteromonas sp. MMG010 TaxID=2822685 RepID=UPI001B3A0097|nr:type II secretion system protein [Pseudoalteromonas sp. MMG010]MBQ4832658.1 type II secretion system protein [Pseudoalteromonas sp. MMG010]
MLASNLKTTQGFTLIELIIGIVMFSVSLTVIVTLIAPQAQQSAAPLIQLRASELGQSLINEIQSKSFDENSERASPFRRCGETSLGAQPCTHADEFGPDNSETRANYNDVDDYIALTGQPITNSLGESLAQYKAFSVVVSVQYDSDFNQATVNDGIQFKRITIEVTSPQSQVFGFTAYKGNY